MKKERFLSLIYPSLSIIASAICLIVIVPGFGLNAAISIIILGLVCGGLMPFFLIIIFEIDISKFLLGKTILFTALVVCVILSWSVFNRWLVRDFNVLVLPLLIFIAEIVFALTRNTNVTTKFCLILSSLVYMYTGFIIDFSRSLAGA